MSNAHDDINYLFKDKMMRRGFHYISKNSEEFSLEIANLKYNISLLANGMLTAKTLKTVSNFVNWRLDRYIKNLKIVNEYVTKHIRSLRINDAELLLSELYFQSQVYFLYNETFTYGVIDPILQDQIAKRKLDLESTLISLSSYKGTAIHAIYKTLAEVPIPNTKAKFLKKYKTDINFSKSIQKLQMEISDYFEEKLSIDKVYSMVEAAKEHIIPTKNSDEYLNLDRTLTKFYMFIVDTQRKLFISQNLYIKSVNKIFERFPKLSKTYGGRKPKGHLLELYLNSSKNLRNHKLLPPNVYYNGFIFNLDEQKRLRLSDLAARIAEMIIEKKHIENISIIDINNTIKELIARGIIGKSKQGSKEPGSYIFMLELALGCNLNCTICFNRNFKRERIVTSDEWNKIIYSIPKNSKIILFGGEPFFYPKIGEILDFMQNTNKNENRNWKIESFTNGVLTDKIISALKEREKLKLILSIDGLASVHNAIRGSGAFEHAVDTIRLLKAETPHEIEVRSVVTAKNYKDIEEFIKFFKSLGVDKITFTDLHVSGNAEKHLDYVLTLNQRLTVLRRLGSCNDMVLTNGHPAAEMYPNSCGIGFNRVYIRSDGLVNGCSELDIADSKIFDAKLDKNGILEDARKLIPKFERDEFDSQDSACARCGLLYLCGGGCRVRALKQTGNINNCDVVQKADIIEVLERISGA